VFYGPATHLVRVLIKIDSKIHLQRKDLFAFQLLDSQRDVIQAYGEIVIQATDRASLMQDFGTPQNARERTWGSSFVKRLILEIKDWDVVREISLNTLTIAINLL